MSDDDPRTLDNVIADVLALHARLPAPAQGELVLFATAILNATPAQLAALDALHATPEDRYPLKRWILEVLGDEDAP